MRVLRASDVQASAVDPRVADACAQVSEERLEQGVRALAFPRSLAETAHNQRAAAWIEEQLRGLGLHVERQGALENVVARPPGLAGACTLAGAHYDSVAGTPGADDNASGVVAVIEAARVLARGGGWPAVAFAFWNGEEDGLLGSREMAARGVAALRFEAVHVLEMVGFCRHEAAPSGSRPRCPSRSRIAATSWASSPTTSRASPSTPSFAPRARTRRRCPCSASRSPWDWSA